MIVDDFQRGNGREEHGFAHTKTRDIEGECDSDVVYQKGFGKGIIEAPEGIWDIDAVMDEVNISWTTVWVSERRRRPWRRVPDTYGTAIYSHAWLGARNTARHR